MTDTSPTHLHAKPLPPMAIRDKTRAAIALMIDELMTVDQAAGTAGVELPRLIAAIAKPDVQKYMEQLNQYHIDTKRARQDRYQVEATERAYHLMLNAKSEAVQARMVELLARGVNQAANPVERPPEPVVPDAVLVGYAYERPDSLSEAPSQQPIDDTQ
jgi:hypothetical protein